jgi:hypothetical protein
VPDHPQKIAGKFVSDVSCLEIGPDVKSSDGISRLLERVEEERKFTSSSIFSRAWALSLLALIITDIRDFKVASSILTSTSQAEGRSGGGMAGFTV